MGKRKTTTPETTTKSGTVAVRVTPEEIGKIDAERERLAREHPGFAVSRGDVLRRLIGGLGSSPVAPKVEV